MVCLSRKFSTDSTMFWQLLTIAALISTTSQEEISTNSCSRDFLFAASQDTNGISLSIFYMDEDYSSSDSHQQLPIAQKQLSGECGEDSFRCENQLVLTTTVNKTAKQHLMFVPLSDGLLITELVQTSVVVKFGAHFFLDTVQNELQHCSPVKVFYISSAYYLVCVDSQQERSYVSMHILYLNKTVLSETKLSTSPVSSFHITADISTLSNFILITEGGVRLVVFAVEDFLYAFDVITYTGFVEYGTIGTNCSHVKRLEYIGNSILLAYCEFVNVYYSVEFDDWEFEWKNVQDGVRYPCPDSSVQLQVFTHPMYLHYTINNRAGNINLLGNGVKKGVCFGDPNNPSLFAYSDMNSGVYVVNMTTQEVTQVVSTNCENPGCLSIDVSENRYLIIRESNAANNNLLVLDAERNLTAVLKVPHYVPGVLSLVTNITYEGCDHPNINGNGIITNDSITGAIVGSIFGALVFVLIIISVSATVILARKNRLSQPIQERPEADGHTESSFNILCTRNAPSTRRVSNLHQTNTIQIHNDSMLTVPTKSVQEVDSHVSKKQVGNTDSAHMLGNEIEIIGHDVEVTCKPATPGHYLGSNEASNVQVPKLSLIDNECGQDNRSESSYSGSIYNDNIPLLPLDKH